MTRRLLLAALVYLYLANAGGAGSLVPASSEAPENRMGEAARLTLAGAGGPAQGLHGTPDRMRMVTDPSTAATPAGPAVAGVPTPSGGVGTALIGGWATFYDDPRQPAGTRYAAAGPILRQAFGHWRGKVIRVTSGKHSTIVSLRDSCACGERQGLPTLLDLSSAAFRDLAPLSAGVIRVEIEVVELPATDATGVPRTADDVRMMLEDR